MRSAGLALMHFADVSRRDAGEPLATGAGFVFMAILAQALIGVVTLLNAAPIALAMLHQAMGLLVLTAAAVHAARAVHAAQAVRAARAVLAARVAPVADRRVA